MSENYHKARQRFDAFGEDADGSPALRDLASGLLYLTDAVRSDHQKTHQLLEQLYAAVQAIQDRLP